MKIPTYSRVFSYRIGIVVVSTLCYFVESFVVVYLLTFLYFEKKLFIVITYLISKYFLCIKTFKSLKTSISFLVNSGIYGVLIFLICFFATGNFLYT